jgi:hypothetical protein
MSLPFSSSKKEPAGFLLVLVLVMGSVFLMIISGFIGYVVTQNQVVNFRFEQQRATEIAEAGLNYYRWYLAHYPDDVTNGTGMPGPYVHQYDDPEGSAMGEFSLDIASSTYCGDISSIEIASTGHTYAEPDAKSTVRGQYSRPSVASYSFVTNSGVWYGPSSNVNGPIHTNQGIRMDASHNSIVSSGQTDWTCDGSYGCSPTQTVDGVFTTSGNANPALFSFPTAPIDFNGVTLDLAVMQDRAQNQGGLYFPDSGKAGYHVIFQPGNQVEVRRVNAKQNEPSGYAWGRYLNILKGTSLVGVYNIDPTCPVIYFADQLWLEGQVDQKVSIAAADIDTAGVDPSIILNNNITYGSPDAGLLAVAEFDMLIGLEVPEDMELNGIFVAQTGHFGRNFYDTSMPNSWEEYIIRDSLTINGTIVSNSRAGYNWVYSSGVLASGFENSESSYDASQVFDPPPYTPITSDVYSFFNWRQDG